MTGSESPVVVVLSESMEPGFARVSSIPFCVSSTQCSKPKESLELKACFKLKQK